MTPIDHTADWRTKLTQAMEGVSEDDHKRLKDDAGDWPTCACGRLDDWIERYDDGSPSDLNLIRLGCRFEMYVHSRSFGKALTTLDAIEQRAMELKP